MHAGMKVKPYQQKEPLESFLITEIIWDLDMGKRLYPVFWWL